MKKKGFALLLTVGFLLSAMPQCVMAQEAPANDAAAITVTAPAEAGEKAEAGNKDASTKDAKAKDDAGAKDAKSDAKADAAKDANADANNKDADSKDADNADAAKDANADANNKDADNKDADNADAAKDANTEADSKDADNADAAKDANAEADNADAAKDANTDAAKAEAAVKEKAGEDTAKDAKTGAEANGDALSEGDTITVKIHASTREGELDKDYAPIVCTSVPKGSTYNEAMAYIKQTEGRNHIDLNNTGKYSLYAAWNSKQSFSAYASEGAAFNDRFTGSEVLNKDTDIYIPYKMNVPVEITVKAPVCGQSASADAPQVTMPEGAKWNNGSPSGFPRWIKGANDPGAYTGFIVGDNDYYIYVVVNLTFGYYSDKNSTAVVNGGEFVTNWMTDGTRYGFFAKVTAVHDWDDGEVTVKPTCTEPGEKTISCKHNGEEWHTEDAEKTEEIAALGHDWGAWKVTKEPTTEAEGEEQRVCARCGEIETRAIPKLDPEEISYRNTSGNGATWEKGSSKTLAFTFKRSVDDKEALAHFTGIQVDGKDVAADKYTAKSGSVIVTLKADYLETLSVGEHKITAFFDDGNDPAATFTITKKKDEKKVTPDNKSSDNSKNNSKKKSTSTNTSSKTKKKSAGKASPKTGDETDMMLWFTLLCVAMCAVPVGIKCREKSRR